MNRLKLFILIFLITTSLPLAFVVYQSYKGLKQEERAQLRFFSITLFDQMERELAKLVQAEEVRAIDEYQYFLADSAGPNQKPPQRSPLAEPDNPAYILGYFQNNPDGSMQTPLVNDQQSIPEQKKTLVARLRQANEFFNTKKLTMPQPQTTPKEIAPKETVQEKRKAEFAERFLKQAEPEQKSSYLGKKTQRVEEISAEQVLNVAREDKEGRNDRKSYASGISRQRAPAAQSDTADMMEQSPQRLYGSLEREQAVGAAEDDAMESSADKFQVEVAPFQSVALQDDSVYMFRRIVIDNQIYRQGFILLVEPFVQYLIDKHFTGQPLAEFTTLAFQRQDQGNFRDIIKVGNGSVETDFVTRRLFPTPFDFLSASLTAHAIPLSPARQTLNVALAILGTFMCLGLIAIYQSARSIVALSERRSQFVSSVTHELKTPLTNIRMYIEMLEQGIATSPEQEQKYLTVLESESARLSGLINNVLELAKLEKKQRHFHLQEGRLDDVLAEVETLMAQKVRSEGFSLTIKKADIPPFAYDREVLLQILVNLIENSLKFGKEAEQREITITADTVDRGVRLAVADSGPGIPGRALKKIFDDFYRVDNALTRTTGGTGIGLALVKKFVSALGGTVQAANNDGPGCTITIVLPV